MRLKWLSQVFRYDQLMLDFTLLKKSIFFQQSLNNTFYKLFGTGVSCAHGTGIHFVYCPVEIFFDFFYTWFCILKKKTHSNIFNLYMHLKIWYFFLWMKLFYVVKNNIKFIHSNKTPHYWFLDWIWSTIIYWLSSVCL